MNVQKLRPASLALLGAILGFATGTAWADITIERISSVDGVGAMAFANMSGTSKTRIAGNKSRIDSDMQMRSKIVGFLVRNAVGPSAEIVLLDDDKLYHLNMNKKEYTETSFAQLRAQMQNLTDQTNTSEDKKQPTAVDQSKCVWLAPKVDMTKNGEKAQFAGNDAQRVTITATQPCQDKETGAICEIVLVLDQWISADFADSAEARQFYTAYASKMGIDISGAQDATDRAKALFGQYKGVWTEVADKMQRVKGYPVKSSFTLGIGGAQCKNSNSQEAQPSEIDNSSSGPGGIAGAVVGKLGGLFQSKKNTTDAPTARGPAVEPVALPPGDVALMTVSSQVVSVSTDSLSADVFIVPAGFKKIEAKTQ
jgi:hypothetical protein